MAVGRVCIFGAGAIGSWIAARLAAAGNEVSIVARGPHLDAVRDRGIRLHADDGIVNARVRASASAAELGEQDVVFVTLKATALRAFADAAAPLLGPDTACVFVQNGVPWWYAHGIAPGCPAPPDLSALDPSGALRNSIGYARTVGAVAYSPNDLVEPGVVRNHAGSRNMLVVGEPDGRASPRTDALRAMLNGAGLYSPAAPDLRAAIWDKLLLNFGATICVPIGEPAEAVARDPALRALRSRMIAEGRAIAAAHGIDVSCAPARPGGPQSTAAGAHKPSILQDYELGRPMEVEAILKAPLAFARAARVDAPALEALAAIVGRMAAAKGLY
ncbi:MAG: ketopantoate reductase family protein [Burkholderiales bacterium]